MPGVSARYSAHPVPEMQRGQPVMRVSENKLSLGAVVEWAEDTRRTVVVIRTGTPSNAQPVSQSEIE